MWNFFTAAFGSLFEQPAQTASAATTQTTASVRPFISSSSGRLALPRGPGVAGVPTLPAWTDRI
jgi:hypothetical protein